MERIYHISDREIEEISTKAEILKRYDREYLEDRELWKTSGGSLPAYKGKDLRRELTQYGAAKNEILKILIEEDNPDPDTIERILKVIELSGLDIYDTDQYERAIDIINPTAKETARKEAKIQPYYCAWENKTRLENVFYELKKEDLISGNLKTFLYVFGVIKEAPNNDSTLVVNMSRNELVRMVGHIAKIGPDYNNDKKYRWPVINKYFRIASDPDKELRLDSNYQTQAWGSRGGTLEKRIKEIVDKYLV